MLKKENAVGMKLMNQLVHFMIILRLKIYYDLIFSLEYALVFYIWGTCGM